MIRTKFRLPRRWIQVITVAGAQLAALAHADPIIRRIDVTTPRNYGYTIGDPILHRVRLEADARYRLDRAALPKRSRLNAWVWLEDVRADEVAQLNTTVYTVNLAYQILAPPQRVSELFVPEQTLWLERGEDRVPVNLAAWAFTAAPLTRMPHPSALPFVDMQPSMTPTPLPLLSRAAMLAFSATVGLSAIAVLLYLHARVPWIARSNGPFARALRELQALHKPLPEAARYGAALRHMHQAFNDTAGSAVFADTLAAFLEAHPKFQVRRDAIAGFFTESRHWFFGGPQKRLPPDWQHLIHLCRNCRDIERGIL